MMNLQKITKQIQQFLGAAKYLISGTATQLLGAQRFLQALNMPAHYS